MEAVITVPAYFNDAQQATKDAGASPFQVKRINDLRQPYGLDKSENRELHYDSGERLISVLDFRMVYSVRSTSGDTYLGGEGFDFRIVASCSTSSKQATGYDDKIKWRYSV